MVLKPWGGQLITDSLSSLFYSVTSSQLSYLSILHVLYLFKYFITMEIYQHLLTSRFNIELLDCYNVYEIAML